MVDALVEERQVLAQLNAKTSLQWIAYGSVWPVGAFDFLVVTLDDTCTNSVGDVGFVVVSTSVDGIVDEEGKSHAHDDSSESGSEDDEEARPSFRSAKSKYSRSCLRMAGYVGQPNDSGGTELTLYLDLDLYAYIPAWLMQLLAQNGLSEMMTRFRDASSHMMRGLDPLAAASGSKLGTMLSQIQVREEKLRSLKGSESAATALPISSEGGDLKPRLGSKDRKEESTAGASESSTASSKGGVKPNYSDIEVLRKLDFSSKALKRLLKYTGKTVASDFPLEWAVKMTKHNIVISATPIANSTWNALKAELVINAEIEVLRKLLVDDSRVGEYDDMFDTCEVLLRIYHFAYIFLTPPCV